MASPLPFLLFSLPSIALALALAPPVVASHHFHLAWSNNTHSFIFWASQNRFHVGDTLHFEYRNDSLLLVNYTNYRDCTVLDPIAKFENGSRGGTIFSLDRNGDFYFISGNREHCVKGQKLAVRVMNDDDKDEDEGVASPQGMDSWNWGPPSLNSTVKARLASYLATVIAGFFSVLYLIT
ncbi:early nodulin-like protein 1 [Cucumis sativus]|uniref:Phytocyanin domain-containing protein n=1 Tax=Cucumis sativus TaxID=3659 RepID=A0A0A0K3H5_CUCSA|nr:early nodulin-like protein 1 [Cucumis sativus]KGN44033.1 hypothetical protein Csa_011863 [Cucumis sativus]